MFSRSRKTSALTIAALLSLTILATAYADESRVLRVAADPNNVPFSNKQGEGFENKIAELIARDLHARIEYVWHAQRRGFFRQTLKEGNADVVMGVPAHFDLALTTSPYYRSTYVFVSRKDRHLSIHSFDDPALRKLKVGVLLIGNDGVNTPPAHALAARGMVNNVIGYTLYGDYAKPNPPARIIDAVVKGDIDLAVVWGPLAGFFARQSSVPLEVVPVTPQVDPPALRYAFDISIGVRKSNPKLRAEIDQILTRDHGEIEQILNEYGVPLVAKQ